MNEEREKVPTDVRQAEALERLAVLGRLALHVLVIRLTEYSFDSRDRKYQQIMSDLIHMEEEGW